MPAVFLYFLTSPSIPNYIQGLITQRKTFLHITCVSLCNFSLFVLVGRPQTYSAQSKCIGYENRT